jgi:hypothetical protein
MKLLLPLLAAMFLIPSAGAFTIGSFEGKWVGTEIDTLKGESIERNLTIVCHRYRGSGLIRVNTLKTAKGIERTTVKYLPGDSHGVLEVTATLNGKPIMKPSSGTWFFSKRTLHSTFFGSGSSVKVALSIVGRRKALRVSANLPDGTKVSGRFERQ